MLLGAVHCVGTSRHCRGGRSIQYQPGQDQRCSAGTWVMVCERSLLYRSALASATLAHIDEHTRFFPPGVGSGRLHGDCWLHGHRTVQKKKVNPRPHGPILCPTHVLVRTAIADDPGRHQGRSQRRALPASRLHAFGIGRVSTAPSVQRECSVAAKSPVALMTLYHLR